MTCDCPIVFPENPEMASQVHRYDCPNNPANKPAPRTYTCTPCGKTIAPGSKVLRVMVDHTGFCVEVGCEHQPLEPLPEETIFKTLYFGSRTCFSEWVNKWQDELSACNHSVQ